MNSLNSFNFVIANSPVTGRFPLYDVQGNYFTGNTLTHFSGSVDIISRTTLDLSSFSSEPILVFTQNGWVLLVSRNNTAVMIASSGELSSPTVDMIRLIVPNISTSRVQTLDRMQLPPFNHNLLAQIENITRQHLPFAIIYYVLDERYEMPVVGRHYPNLSGLNIISEQTGQPGHMFGGVIPLEETIDTREWVRPPEIVQEDPNLGNNVTPYSSSTQTNIRNNEMIQQSYEILMKQLYGIPVQLPQYLVINGLRVNFVPFEQIGQMLSQNQIERYIIDPLLQPFAGPPGTEYRIFTFFGKNGVTYLVRAKYNPQTNQIFS